MITVFCVLLVLGLGHCQNKDVPPLSEIENSINRTIEEVERMVRENPKLPQLSRKEIVNILYNITTKDIEALQDQQKIDKARKLYQRALMVVLPYNGEGSSENLKDLYTKPPMTQIVPDIRSPDEIRPDDVMEHRAEKDSSSPDSNDVTDSIPESLSTTTENVTVTTSTQKVIIKEVRTTTPKGRYKNHRETYSEIHRKVPLKETLKRDSAPVRFTFNLDNLQKKPQTPEKIPITTRRPIFRKELYEKKAANSSKLEIVYSTSSSTEASTTESKELEIDLKTTKQPEVKNDQNILSSDQWKYNAPPRSTGRPITTARPPPKIYRFRSKPVSSTTVRTTSEEAMVASKRPEIMKKIPKTTMKPIRVENEIPSTSLYVTPMSSEPPPKHTSSKYSSTYSVSSVGLSTTTSNPMRPEVMDLLASIGLRPDNDSNIENVYKMNQESLKSKVQIPDTNSVVYTTTSGWGAIGSDSPSIVTQNSFEGPGAEIKKGVQNLTPDVQLLFQKFGLQTSNLAATPPTTTTQRTVVTNSYTNFKPLPTSSVKDEDMREFLARFGLGGSDSRREKAMKATRKRPSVIEAVPDNMKNVLENIGLISNSRKKLSSKVKAAQSTESKHHVFKPHEVSYGDEKQRVKINELLDTVKMVQQGRGHIEDVHKAANDLLQTTKTLKGGPDPLSLEEIIKIYNEDVKNEVKRQQQEQPDTTTVKQMEENSPTSPFSTETSSSTTSKSEDSASLASEAMDSVTTATDLFDLASSATPATSTSNLKDLEDSFGGTTQAPDPVLPTRPKTGLYFLVDWNTFLEVGEEGRDKVNLRFQPKAGDRTRFLPVVVP